MSSVEASVPVRIVVGFLLAFTAFATLTVVAAAMTDPGGVEGAALAALWVVPMLSLMAGVLALQRPTTSGRTLTVLGAVVFVTSLAGPGSRPLAVMVLPLLLAGVLIWVLASASRRTRSDTSP